MGWCSGTLIFSVVHKGKATGASNEMDLHNNWNVYWPSTLVHSTVTNNGQGMRTRYNK